MSTGEDLKFLSEKLEAVMRRLDFIEAILTEQKNYPELAAIMGDLKLSATLYNEPLKLIQRLILARRYEERTSEPRDETSRFILNALAVKGPLNISALTGERKPSHCT